jgi:hypothetical protein
MDEAGIRSAHLPAVDPCAPAARPLDETAGIGDLSQPLIAFASHRDAGARKAANSRVTHVRIFSLLDRWPYGPLAEDSWDEFDRM